MKRDLLSLLNLKRSTITELLELTEQLKLDKYQLNNQLKGQTIALVFQCRTRRLFLAVAHFRNDHRVLALAKRLSQVRKRGAELEKAAKGRSRKPQKCLGFRAGSRGGFRTCLPSPQQAPGAPPCAMCQGLRNGRGSGPLKRYHGPTRRAKGENHARPVDQHNRPWSRYHRGHVALGGPVHKQENGH